MNSNLSKINYNIIIVFFSFLLLGLFIYRDYGFNIDEKFHRLSGFYWLNYIADFFNLELLEKASKEKLLSIEGFTLSNIQYYNKYGIIFDVPAAFLEIILKINTPIEFYYLRHLLVFFYFFIGLIFFFKILKNRFQNTNIALFGVVLLFLTPRLFGDSFQNTKDIIFLSFLIISTHFSFKIIDKFTLKNVLLFSFFSATSISTRLFGFILPVSLIVMNLILMNKNNYKKKLFNISLLIFFNILFIILVWPLLWENPISNFLSYFKILDDYFNAKVFFLGKYYNPDLLPFSYTPIWIIISTPILHLVLFFLGFALILRRFLSRFLSVGINNNYSDFWRGKNEAKDFFIFINFIGLLTSLVFLNIKMYNSWRLGYFLYLFIIYFGVYGVYLIYTKKNYLLIHKFFINVIIISLTLLTVCRMIIYHPYQSLYFNILTPKIVKNNVEVDYTGLSSFNFLKKVIDTNNVKGQIKLGVASWYPIWRVLELIEHKNKIKIVSTNDNFKADILYTNRISEVDKKYNDKYDIPENFEIMDELIIDGIIIYQSYERKK